MIVISHPTGNQNFRNAAVAFLKEEQLAKVFTTINWNHNSVLANLLPKKFLKELSKRNYSCIPPNCITSYPYFEFGRLLSNRIGLKSLTKYNTGFFAIDNVYRTFDSYVSKKLLLIPNVTAVYCYEDGAFESFKRAKNNGIKTIYELPIGYWRAARQILGEEIELKPEWAGTILSGRDNPEKLGRKDEEINLADKIIVPSAFVAETLKLYEGNISEKIQIVPYGGPKAVDTINPAINKKLKVLFVGGLSQRKGLSYLFEAINKLQGIVSLTVIGTKITNECNILNKELLKHQYLSGLPQTEVLKAMYEHDVLVFPSLFEGFGLVILEAMAQGIPVITTKNAGPGTAIIDGKNGFIIPIRSYEEISTKILCLAENRELLREMKIAALEQAKKSSWESYQKTLVKSVFEQSISNV